LRRRGDLIKPANKGAARNWGTPKPHHLNLDTADSISQPNSKTNTKFPINPPFEKIGTIVFLINKVEVPQETHCTVLKLIDQKSRDGIFSL
tara:strand:- start:556 stop:828 length:273 start_codon:yes stop_codon:yes gene_type:complete